MTRALGPFGSDLPVKSRRKPITASTSPMVLVYAVGFLNLQLSAGLLGAWRFPNYAIAGVSVLVFLCLIATPKSNNNFPLKPNKLLMATLLAILSMTILASYYTYQYAPEFVVVPAVNGIIYFTFVSLVNILIIFDARARYGQYAIKYLVEAFFIAALLFAIVQVWLLTFGFTNPLGDIAPQIKGDAVFSNLLGWRNSRQMLPVSSAFQSGGAIPLALCVMAAANLTIARNIVLSFIAIGLGLFLLLLLDAQQFLLSIILATLAISFIKSDRIFALVCCLSPWFYVSFVGIGRNFVPFLLQFANSRGNDRFGLFTGREFIWSRFWDYTQRADWSQIIFGNGVYGQGISRLSDSYAVVFGSFPRESRYLAHLHNSYLQVIVDNGILGLILYTSMIGFSAYGTRTLSRRAGPNSYAWRSMAMVVAAIAFAGASEVVFTIYMKEALVMTVFAMTTIAMCGGDIAGRLSVVRTFGATRGVN